MKGITSSAPLSLGFLSSFNGICKALFMLFPIKAIGYFLSFNDIFSSDNRFIFLFSSSKIVQMLLVKQDVLLVKSNYIFESVCLLYISIQTFVPLLLIIISQNGKFAQLMSIVNCKLGFTWLKTVSKSLRLTNLVFSRILQSSKNRN